MKTVKIKYNPYLLKTDITIDGKEPQSNSSLHFGKQRLQEWAEKFVKIFIDEYRDANVTMEFTGSLDDYNDLKETIEASSDIINVAKWSHNCIQDVEEVEKEVIKIFNEIQQGPVDKLKDQVIIDSFKQATSAQFCINVVATMSAGKSTLINALLGKKLMPMAQMATTATIVRIIASNSEYFSAIAKNQKDEEVAREENISYETMKAWNSDERISSIDIYGPIPCVNNVGMRLVLIDTPGPNNSRDERHKAMTYGMLESSEKSLVLFVINATTEGTDDESALMDYVSECMKNGGKQSRDRYIFAVNKLDTYDPENDSVAEVLAAVKKTLDKRDIVEPNLFPAAALPCLQIRDKEIKKRELRSYESLIEESDEFKFDEYYQLNHLPVSSRIRLENSNNEYSETELHTGIPSIEEAIRLYVNKYARTMKVRDLVDSFNQRLKSLKAVAEFEKQLRDNKEEKERLLSEIATMEEQISSGQSATNYKELIDNVDTSKTIESEVNKLSSFLTRIDKLIHSYDNKTKVPKYEAERIVEDLESKREDMIEQLESRLSSIYNNCFKSSYEMIINQYRQKLSKLGFKTSDDQFEFNPIDFIGEELYDIDSVLRRATYKKDEGRYVPRTEKYTVKQERSIFNPKRWFGDKYYYETKERTVREWEANIVEYVNMSTVVESYFEPLYEEIVSAKSAIVKHITDETKRLKETLKKQIKEVEKILAKKLNEVRKRVSDADRTQKEIEEQESNLKWMNGIITRVNNLINY